MIKHYIYKLLIGVKVFFGERIVVMRGQSNKYNILQTAHRLEKGLINKSPKPGWGKEKAIKLVDMLSKEAELCGDAFALNTGIGVLRAYLDQKWGGTNDDINIAKEIENRNTIINGLLKNASERYGRLDVQKEDVILSDVEKTIVSKFINNRHSVREYDNKDLDEQDLFEAVKLALRCPSACNRQPFHVYAISGKKREKLGFNNAFGAPRYLIVTCDINAFKVAEYNDWIFNGGIFTGYLSLALHSKGIGSCVMRRDLVFGSEYNDAIRKACRIPSNEKIVIELATGYYKDEFRVAYSNRRNPESIVTYID